MSPIRIPPQQCAWVAPARTLAGDELVLKVGWRHREAEHEADGLRHWDEWARAPQDGHPFSSLAEMCSHRAEWLELDYAADSRGLDAGLVREGVAMLRQLPNTADSVVLLCTDLHAGNVLASGREPWLVIDPKPFVDDPAYDSVQHMLNCDERLATDPRGLARRMAELLDLEPDRVRLWLFARCVQESLHDLTMREPARRLAPS